MYYVLIISATLPSLMDILIPTRYKEKAWDFTLSIASDHSHLSPSLFSFPGGRTTSRLSPIDCWVALSTRSEDWTQLHSYFLLQLTATVTFSQPFAPWSYLLLLVICTNVLVHVTSCSIHLFYSYLAHILYIGLIFIHHLEYFDSPVCPVHVENWQ